MLPSFLGNYCLAYLDDHRRLIFQEWMAQFPYSQMKRSSLKQQDHGISWASLKKSQEHPLKAILLSEYLTRGYGRSRTALVTKDSAHRQANGRAPANPLTSLATSKTTLYICNNNMSTCNTQQQVFLMCDIFCHPISVATSKLDR